MTKALRRRVVSKRPDPEPCRDQDLGKFEVTARDGAARLGKLFTRVTNFRRFCENICGKNSI